MLRIRPLVLKFSDNTSAHGVSDVKNAQSIYWRLIWIVAMTVSLTICCFQIAQTTIDYYRWPVETNIEIKYQNNPSFPGVTICNLNMLKRSLMERDYPDVMMEIEQAKMHVYSQSANKKNSNESTNVIENLRKWLKFVVYERKIDVGMYGHQLDDMMLSCSFQGIMCLPEQFIKWQHVHYGNCYTLIVVEKSGPTMYGPDYGLQLELFTEEKEYLPMLSETIGFRILVDNEMYVPLPESRGTTISPGSSTIVRFSAERLERLAKPYGGGDCKEDTKSLYAYELWRSKFTQGTGLKLNYSIDACLDSCNKYSVLKECGCIPDMTWQDAQFWPGPNTKMCGTDHKAHTCILSFFEPEDLDDRADSCQKRCPSMCHEDLLLREIITNKWPSEDYFQAMMPLWFSTSEGLCEQAQAAINYGAEATIFNFDCAAGNIFEQMKPLLAAVSSYIVAYFYKQMSIDEQDSGAESRPDSQAQTARHKRQADFPSPDDLTTDKLQRQSDDFGDNSDDKDDDDHDDFPQQDQTGLNSNYAYLNLDTAPGPVSASQPGKPAHTEPGQPPPGQANAASPTGGKDMEKMWKYSMEQGTSSVREMVADLSIFYKDMSVRMIVESPKYNVWSLLSNMGGTLGLYSGLSLLSILQLIQLIAEIIFQLTVPEKKEKKVDKKKSVVHAVDSNPTGGPRF